jgi:hypothetical protein
MKKILLTGTMIGLSSAAPIAAATLVADTETTAGWNTSNVFVGDTPSDGVTGESVVYNETWPIGESVPPTADTSGKVVFTPPEAVSPGLEVNNYMYFDSSNPSGLALDGCIKTSSLSECDGPFQSGKRIKQVMTASEEPMDLVFNLDPDNLTAEATYQVFGRLINKTAGDLDGFKVELGFGVGDSFQAAAVGGPLTLSMAFTAQPGSATNVTTQYPFGLFGDALGSPNFVLDGFFDDERTGFNVTQNDSVAPTAFEAAGYFGNYEDLFGDWLSSKVDLGTEPLPEGVFWDFDANVDTDNLLMAWERPDGKWELKRTVGEFCGPTSSTNDTEKCSPGLTLETPVLYDSRADAEAALTAAFALLNPADFSDDTLVTADTAIYSGGPIEDLANLNLNYAIQLGDFSDFQFVSLFDFEAATPTFTLRTTVFAANELAPVPLPAGAPLLLASLAMIGFLRKRQAA